MDKCSDPKPFQATGGGNGCDVSPLKDGESFTVGQPQELALFDSVAQEQIEISGTSIDYWSINSPDSERDVLYGEPKVRRFAGPYRFKVNFTAPSQTPQVREEGLTSTWDASAWVPRKSFEDAHAPIPSEGDVLHSWDLPIYEAMSTMEQRSLPGAGYYFDVMTAEPESYIADTPNFVGYKLTLKRRAEFTPERRLVRP